MNSPASSAATARTPDHAASSASASAIRSRRSRRGEAWWSSPRGRGSAVARSRPTTARSRTGPTTRRRAYALPPSNFPHARDLLAGGSERLLCAAESRSATRAPPRRGCPLPRRVGRLARTKGGFILNRQPNGRRRTLQVAHELPARTLRWLRCPFGQATRRAGRRLGARNPAKASSSTVVTCSPSSSRVWSSRRWYIGP